MGFRFFKRLNILPGVQLNLSKSGGSVSVGPRGAKMTLGTSGGRMTFGLPGTGLFYTTNFSLKKLGKLFGGSSDAAETPETAAPPTIEAPPLRRSARRTAAEPEKLSPDFFDSLPTNDEQKELAAGCQALVRGDEEAALAHLQQATHLADGAFLAGFLALKRGRLPEAIRALSVAAVREAELGRYLSRYGIAATMRLDVTEEVTAHVGPDLRGVLLALAEAYQLQDNRSEAVGCLERLRQLTPDDVVVNLSLAELLMQNGAADEQMCRQVLALTDGVENETSVHTALLLYRAKALLTLGLADAALETIARALKRKKDRSDELLHALRYERALIYEGRGESRKARAELEKLYAEAPDYEDVKARLGL
ncbi:MAG: DUF4236 domain-containing protein [Deltaproteobacteria bacterium]|nr:DUF4236 domain-containing protein [Deltaproteobacteria bacterium]